MSGPERIVVKIVVLVYFTVGLHVTFVEARAVPWPKPGSNLVAAWLAEVLLLSSVLVFVCAYERLDRLLRAVSRHAPDSVRAGRGEWPWAVLFVALLASGAAMMCMV